MRLSAVGWLAAICAACVDHGAAAPPACLRGTFSLALANNRIDALDVLLVLDDSAAMRPRAAAVQRALAGVAEALVHPAPGEVVDSLQIAVVSADLGAPVAGCTAVGDDGRLGPRACAGGAALPPFLLFDADLDAPPFGPADLVCATELGTDGCSVQQPLEAAYRALIERDARAVAGNVGPNAGFVRPDAVLAIVVIAPQDDASARDCRHPEPEVACDAAVDGLWDLDRYIDARHPARGFTGLKPNRPENVIFTAATAVRPDVPVLPSGAIDWDVLLAAAAGGAGPTRLLTVAQRFATTYSNGSVVSIERDDLTPLTRLLLQRIQSRFADRCLPRTIAARRGSPCCDAARAPEGCAVAPGCLDASAVATRCAVTERLGATTDPAAWCTAAHGRRRLADRAGRPTCRVDQIAVAPGTTAPRGAHGFFHDTSSDPANASCPQRISFTRGDGLPYGSEGIIECDLDPGDGC